MNTESEMWFKDQLKVSQIDAITQFRSDKNNRVYKIATAKGNYVLKQGHKLKSERDRLVWLQGKLLVPECIAWRVLDDDREELLMVAIEGEDLSRLVHAVSKQEVIQGLSDALHIIHEVDISDCSFGEKKDGLVFTHGDACLPNFIFRNNQLVGIIDVGAAGIADKEVDLAAAVWSLAFNCGPGLGVEFLRAYGVTSVNENDEIRLIKKYEPTWSGY